VGYPNKLIEQITDKAAEFLDEGNERGFAIGRALDLSGFKRANDRNDVFRIIRQKLRYRANAKKRSLAKQRTVAAKNLVLPFPPPRDR